MEGKKLNWEVYEAGWKYFYSRMAKISIFGGDYLESMSERIFHRLLIAAEKFDASLGVKASTYGIMEVRITLRRHPMKPAEMYGFGGFDDKKRPLDKLPSLVHVAGDKEQYIPRWDSVSIDQHNDRIVDKVIASEELGEVRKVLDQRSFDLLKMRYIEQRTGDETAKVMGISKARVGQIEDRAINRVREKLPHLLDGE